MYAEEGIEMKIEINDDRSEVRYKNLNSKDMKT